MVVVGESAASKEAGDASKRGRRGLHTAIDVTSKIDTSDLLYDQHQWVCYIIYLLVVSQTTKRTYHFVSFGFIRLVLSST